LFSILIIQIFLTYSLLRVRRVVVSKRCVGILVAFFVILCQNEPIFPSFPDINGHPVQTASNINDHHTDAAAVVVVRC
jgi:hypothetical protein